MPQLTKTELQTAIRYLEDALLLYDALGVLPMQKAVCRAHMIRQLTKKLKQKLTSAK